MLCIMFSLLDLHLVGSGEVLLFSPKTIGLISMPVRAVLLKQSLITLHFTNGPFSQERERERERGGGVIKNMIHYTKMGVGEWVQPINHNKVLKYKESWRAVPHCMIKHHQAAAYHLAHSSEGLLFSLTLHNPIIHSNPNINLTNQCVGFPYIQPNGMSFYIITMLNKSYFLPLVLEPADVDDGHIIDV